VQRFELRLTAFRPCLIQAESIATVPHALMSVRQRALQLMHTSAQTTAM